MVIIFQQFVSCLISKADDYYDPKEDRPRMKRPKIKYHPKMTGYKLLEGDDVNSQKNWLNLECGKYLS